MHTFFVNTSGKELQSYDVLFDIHRENKTLVSMACPVADWYDPQKGYSACVKEMGDMIDGYVELDNTFNLIVYIDLPEDEVYAALPADAAHDDEREACSSAMHILFTHMISESIVDTLTRSDRKPQNVLIMFGEEKEYRGNVDIDAGATPENKIQRIFAYLGLPSMETIAELARKIGNEEKSEEEKKTALKEAVLGKCGRELVRGIRDKYDGVLTLWCDQIIAEGNPAQAKDDLYKAIRGIYDHEQEGVGIQAVSCTYNSYACRENQQMLALTRLNVALHLLRCVEDQSIFMPVGDGEGKTLIPFRRYTAQEVAPFLAAKKKLFADKATAIASMELSYVAAGMVQPLRAFDHDKFGLDEHGDKAFDLVISAVEAAPADEQTQNGAAGKDDTGDKVAITGNNMEVKVVEKQGEPMFSADVYKPFDYHSAKKLEKLVPPHATPEEYEKGVKEIKKHHLDYLKRLKENIGYVLSNYAGESKEGKPALLRVGEYRYAAQGKETRVLDTVRETAEKSYATMLREYMEFCAGRSVAVTDIVEQCDWFVTRIHQIKQSLIKVKRVALGLLLAILILYVPFAVLQWEDIVANLFTVAMAVGSLVVPILLLCGIVGIVSWKQRKKYRQVWDEFNQKHREALQENKIAAEKYDQLLSTVVPALRWVYEYKLDVEYYAECDDAARAKRKHHRNKLESRERALQNILTDLEQKNAEPIRLNDEFKLDFENADPVDYNVPFCSGEKNRRFYSVIDRFFFKRFEQ